MNKIEWFYVQDAGNGKELVITIKLLTHRSNLKMLTEQKNGLMDEI